MIRFLFISTIVFVLAVSLPGCGKAPDQRATAPEPSPQEAAEPMAVKNPKPQQTAHPAEATESVRPSVRTKATENPAADLGSTTVAEVIEMKNTTAFETHTRAIVMFTHKKHTAPVPDGHGLFCGECHHDENGQPLKLEEGDYVQSCQVCHAKTGRPRKPADMSREEWETAQLEYYYGAIHANCIDCHKAREAGPTKCNECHPKEGATP